VTPCHLTDDIRVWFATETDREFVRYLDRQFRNWEFFYAPEESVLNEIHRKNIICFDYRRLEAGYIWMTFPRHGRARINHLAVSEELWRNKVGTDVVTYVEREAGAHGCWSIYLSCNSNTPGHHFWPTVGFSPVMEKEGGKRGGMNYIWGQLLPDTQTLFTPTLADIKNKYELQNGRNVMRRAAEVGDDWQIDLL
jgi:GNAT superfamily N-acetyltransferase